MNITKEEKIKILAMRIANDKGVVDPLKLAEGLLEINEELENANKRISLKPIGKIDLGTISNDWKKKYGAKRKNWWEIFKDDDDDDNDYMFPSHDTSVSNLMI